MDTRKMLTIPVPLELAAFLERAAQADQRPFAQWARKHLAAQAAEELGEPNPLEG